MYDRPIASTIKNPSRLFWLINSTAWLLVVLINTVFQTKYFQTNYDAIGYSFLIGGVGFLASLIIRYFVLKLKLIDQFDKKAFPKLFILAIGVAFLSVALFIVCILSFFPGQTLSTDAALKSLFNFSLILLIWTLTYAGYLFFEHQQFLARQQLNLSLQLKQAELNNIRKQLSPHFLFNAINNIRALIKVDPDKAREALIDVSDLLRYALNYQKRQTVSIAEEMEIVKGYVNLNMIHLGANVRFDLNVDPSVDRIDIPPMSIQLLVENAIKHGDLQDGAVIVVRSAVINGKQIMEVSNPGSLNVNNNEGIGLSNLKHRLKDLFEDRHAFKIFEQDGRVIAQIHLG